jgi:hypothetical protein
MNVLFSYLEFLENFQYLFHDSFHFEFSVMFFFVSGKASTMFPKYQLSTSKLSGYNILKKELALLLRTPGNRTAAILPFWTSLRSDSFDA